MSNYKRKDGQRDFPELEGKIVEYHFRDGRVKKLKVVGCNYDIGITMVYCNNTDKHAYCCNGPLSPNKNKYWEDTYDRSFYAAVRMIQQEVFKGTVDFAICNKTSVPVAQSNTGSTGGIQCAFSV